MTREAFEKWYNQGGYYHDTVSDRKELMLEAWQARESQILTLLQSDEAREKVADAFAGVSEATIYVPSPAISELKCAELNAKEWFTHGWNAALNALQQMIKGE